VAMLEPAVGVAGYSYVSIPSVQSSVCSDLNSVFFSERSEASEVGDVPAVAHLTFSSYPMWKCIYYLLPSDMLLVMGACQSNRQVTQTP
jgi:hypothetical protein